MLTRRKFVTSAAAAMSVVLLPPAPAEKAIDRDLLEATVTRLHELYAAKKYTATQVTQWHLDRIAHYNKVYRALLHVDAAGALKTAATLDRDREKAGALWGIPIVIKANTSVKGLVTTAGWSGYLIPGHELVAPADATVVARLRAAGAIILAQTNMPDFAASDSNYSSAYGRTGNAYDARFSPGGSSGGTVTAVTANFALLGNGTDTGNSIRMPSATSAVVGVLPTRGLVSIAGIHPLDWLLDNTGPIARNVTDAAIALDVMAGQDALDFRTKDSAPQAQAGPYTQYLSKDALKNKRFGVPAFIVKEPTGDLSVDGSALQASTREMFSKALEELRASGATVVVDETLLPASFTALIDAVNTQPYVAEGVETFLRYFGPAEYHSALEYALAVGSPLPGFLRGMMGPRSATQRVLADDPQADETFWGPQRKALAAYDEALERFHLDGLVYPALQMPPVDETIPLRQGRRSDGPHSKTAWVNKIGVPAVVVPAGFYETGLPFGIELSALRWKDGDLLGWAYAYEQATKHRKPPVLTQ